MFFLKINKLALDLEITMKTAIISAKQHFA